jgi:predicted phage terminase large subunit-like protein
MEFPQLKDLALREYKSWNPDCFVIEKKSNGAPLAQEMRRMGIPIQEYVPVRGSTNNSNSKYARVNSVADIVRSGLVWAPEYKWADEVIEQCNEFPSGKNDDMVDTVVMALMRFRSGGFISLPSDEKDDNEYKFRPKRAAYY